MENPLTTVLSQLAFTKAEDPSETLQLLSSSCCSEPLCQAGFSLLILCLWKNGDISFWCHPTVLHQWGLLVTDNS